MSVTPQDLQEDSNFERLDQVGHKDMVPFVLQYYFDERTWLLGIHWMLTLGTAIAWLWIGITQGTQISAWLAAALWAVLVFLLIVPVHEALHGLGYYLLGARDLRYSGSLRSLYVYVIAHDFVATAREVTWVALAPFFVINSLLVVAAFLWPEQRLLWVGVLLLHLQGTAGDWQF